MKTTEIMINDLFYVEDGEGKHIVRITSIDSPVESVRGICLDNGEDTGWFSVDFLIPIVVEEEILKVNGFEKEGEYMTILLEGGRWLKFPKHYTHYINIYKLIDCFDVVVVIDDGRLLNCRVKYIHELQHALRLCGLDDIANNFKMN